MIIPRHPRALATLTVLTAATALLAGCATSEAASTPSAGASSDASGFPLTIENCSTQITLDAAPQRIVLVNNDAIPDLEALDAIDRVVGITATPTADLYAQSTYDALDALTPLSTETNSTGGSVVSQEAIIGMSPDLVIAPEKGVDRDALAAAGIPVYTPSAYCTDPPAAYTTTATFDRVWDELTAFGEVLGEPEAAAATIADAQSALEDLQTTDAGTAAALYVSSGGSVLSPYGGPSMVTPVFEAAGLSNVYADEDQRVFDANIEDIIARDPGTIVLLYSSGTPEDVIATFLSAPGVDGLTAVAENRVVALPFAYTDPPTVFTAQGPQKLLTLLADLA